MYLSAIAGGKTGGVVGWSQVPALLGPSLTFISMVVTGAQAWLSMMPPAEQVLDSTQQPRPVSPPAIADRHIKTQTDVAGSQFLDDEGGDGCRNVGLFTIQLFNMADSLRIFYLGR
jgi:hypothetical protein